MKIENLFVSNFLGLTALDVTTREPVQLFAGRNGAGKSSLRDAVALALTADLGRVGLKKEAPALIHAGAESAVCEVGTSDGDTYTVSLSAGGKITDSRKGRDVDPVLQYVLDAQRFARLEDKERRGFLFGLMGLKTDGPAIVKRLVDKGGDKAKIDRLAPLLRSGFPAACTEAKAKATGAKGAWRAVTGETYGSEKGKTWCAAVPPHDAAAAKKVATELQHLDVALESWQQQIGKAELEHQRRAGLRQKLPALQEQALRVDRVQKKQAVDLAELLRLDTEIQKTEAAAGGGQRVGLVHDLAKSLAWCLSFENPHADKEPEEHEAIAALAAYEETHGKVGADAGDPAAAARLPALRTARATCASAVANDRRDLEACASAQTNVDSIEAELANPADAADLDQAHKQVAELKVQRAELVAKRDAQSAAKAAADAADKKTEAAGQHHADVAAWDLLGDALGPDGIPGEILAEALGPLNARLAAATADTGWLQAEVTADMAITGAGRAYRLLSESEQWRVDAMLAEAISFLSGTKLLVLDRFDVLDLAARGQLLQWLDVLADAGEIATALLFGTLKAAPTGLPPTIGVHWIENGHAGQLKEAA